MALEQTQLDFSQEGGESDNTQGEHLRVVKSPETEETRARKTAAAEKYGIVIGSPTYESMYERDGQLYIENETVEAWDARMNNLDNDDDVPYYRGQQ